MLTACMHAVCELYPHDESIAGKAGLTIRDSARSTAAGEHGPHAGRLFSRKGKWVALQPRLWFILSASEQPFEIGEQTSKKQTKSVHMSIRVSRQQMRLSIAIP